MLHPHVHTFIPDLYDAALETRAWQGLGVRLAMALGGQTSALWLMEHGQVSEMVSSLPAEAMALYQQHYHALDPWAALAGRTPRLEALLGPELVPQQEVLASAFYHEWGALFGVCHVVGAVIPLDTRAAATLGVALERPEQAQAFTEADRQRLTLVLPHLQRAAQIRRRLGQLEAHAQTGWAVLDVLPLGIVVAVADGTIVCANATAEALARGDEGAAAGGALPGSERSAPPGGADLAGARRRRDSRGCGRPAAGDASHSAPSGGAGGAPAASPPPGDGPDAPSGVGTHHGSGGEHGAHGAGAATALCPDRSRGGSGAGASGRPQCRRDC